MILNKFKKIILILIVLTPLGVILPDFINNHGTWGEWTNEEIHEMIGYIPVGIKSYSTIWSSFLADYSLNIEFKNKLFYIIEYLSCGLIGILTCYFITSLLFKTLVNVEK